MKSLFEKVRAEFDDLRAKGLLNAPAIHRVSAEVYREIKKWPAADRDRFCDELFSSQRWEQGALVCYVYRRFAKQCGAREFRMFTRWLDRDVHDWGMTDGLGLWLLGASIANDPSLIAKLDSWTRSKNRWKRRAAAVALVPSARGGINTDEIFRIAAPLLPDQDDMVQKGVGWLLKETYPKRPAHVMRFLLPRRGQTSRSVLRYPNADRRFVAVDPRTGVVRSSSLDTEIFRMGTAQ